jgi:hypothetical protein
MPFHALSLYFGIEMVELALITDNDFQYEGIGHGHHEATLIRPVFVFDILPAVKPMATVVL